MKAKPIINAHMHLLSNYDIPVGFPNKAISKIANTKVGYALLKGILHNANPFKKSDSLDKLLTFVKASRIGSEKELFEDVAKYYPSDTCFVALTMNMHHMGAGRCKRTYYEGLKALDELRDVYPRILPFYMADCRDENMNSFFDHFLLQKAWTGVKAYPPLGTFPQDERYNYVYEKCQELGIPIMAHCTYGSPVHFKGKKKELKKLLGSQYDKKLSKKDNCSKFTNPLNWAIVAKRYPDLKICLAHAGGSEQWKEWLSRPGDKDNLLNEIIEIMREYPNIYTDISFTANKDFAVDVLYTLLTEPKFKFIHNRILFGSDWYMNLTETTEAEWSIGLKRKLGVKLFNKIARENPYKYLNL